MVCVKELAMARDTLDDKEEAMRQIGTAADLRNASHESSVKRCDGIISDLKRRCEDAEATRDRLREKLVLADAATEKERENGRQKNRESGEAIRRLRDDMQHDMQREQDERRGDREAAALSLRETKSRLGLEASLAKEASEAEAQSNYSTYVHIW